MSLNITKVISFIFAAISPVALASVANIKQNYQHNPQISDSFTHSGSKPGYQVSTAPNVNWNPRLNLDNAYGRPSINLDNANGSITKTNGVSQSVKDYVNSQIANATPPPPPKPVGWVVIYSGSGKNSIPVSGAYGQWRVTVVANGQSSRVVAGTQGGSSYTSFSTSYSIMCNADNNYLNSSGNLHTAASITASASSISIPSSVTGQSLSKPHYSCNVSGSRPQITGIRITMAEVYRP